MEWLDNAGKAELANIRDKEIMSHIETCNSCGKYYRVSVALTRMESPVPEMWDAFEEKLVSYKNTTRIWNIRYAIASIAGSLVIAVGLIFNPWTNSDTTVASYPYADQLDYSGELATTQDYTTSVNDPLECYYTLSMNY
jgi:hypothetical protein